jgi:hypothetical protein
MSTAPYPIQSTPNPHLVSDLPTGVVFVCFQLFLLKRCCCFKIVKKFHFQNQSSQRTATKTRSKGEGESQNCTRRQFVNHHAEPPCFTWWCSIVKQLPEKAVPDANIGVGLRFGKGPEIKIFRNQIRTRKPFSFSETYVWAQGSLSSKPSSSDNSMFF